MKIYPVVKKITIAGGGGGDADIVWTDTPHLRDAPRPLVTLPDLGLLHVTDRQGSNVLTLPETQRLADQRIVPALSAVYPETPHLRDALLGSLENWDIARSGTPDADALGDGWVDGIPLNNGVNHGNENPLHVSGDTILTTEQSAYLEYDLTRFTSVTAPTGGTLALTVQVRTLNLALLETLTADFSKKTTRPFVESTLNFTNRPAVGTNLVTKTVGIGVLPTVFPYTITLTAAEYGPYLGGWLMVRFHSAALLANEIQITSRESATAGQRPLLSFAFARS